MKVEKFYVIFIVSFLCLYSAISDNASITIIGTMGGYIYGIDSLSLEKKWTVDTGGPLLSAEQVFFTLFRLPARHCVMCMLF